MDTPILSEIRPRVISRDEAKELGLKRYFTGEPCKRGHVCERYTSSTICRDCNEVANKAREANEEGPKCSVQECARNATSKGFCKRHYELLRYHGTIPEKTRSSPGERAKWIENNKDYSGEDCLIWPFGTRRKYPTTLWQGEYLGVHVIMCRLKNGPKPHDSFEAAHSCGNGRVGCVAPTHLRWLLPIDNALDKHLHGTVPYGELSGTAKLTDEDIPVIRSLHGVVSLRALGRRYGVSKTTIRDVISRKTWPHIK